MKRHLMWFRSDLRVADNPALENARRQVSCVDALYVDCPGQWREHGRGRRQLDFIARNLDALQEALRRMDVNLHRLECESFADVPALLNDFIEDHDIAAVFANRETGVDESRRDQSVDRLINAKLILTEGECVVPPGSLLNGKGEMFQVFTPFRKAWMRHVQQHGYRLLARNGPSFDQHKDDENWPAGEESAHQRLSAFCDDQLQGYAEDRDFPALAATSGLSPYLALGVLSPAQCLGALESRLGFLPLSPGESGFAWLNELIWREFYRHLMTAFPRLSMNRAFKQQTEKLAWSNDRERFQAWCDGQTGFPIIDAAMRCLQQTGWMHNRLRMIVAGFLVKDLNIDWRRGERYFMSQLIDADFPSNNGGWQWSAGTGADAAPYFRIFNPTTQSQRYDKQGEFIRQWVAELRAVPDRFIHAPHAWLTEQARQREYVPPLVDHRLAREQCLQRFQALKPTETTQ